MLTSIYGSSLRNSREFKFTEVSLLSHPDGGKLEVPDPSRMWVDSSAASNHACRHWYTIYYIVTICSVIQIVCIVHLAAFAGALCARAFLYLQVTMTLIQKLTRLSGYVHLKQGLECLGTSSQSKRLQHTASHSSSCNYQLLPDCLGERHSQADALKSNIYVLL